MKGVISRSRERKVISYIICICCLLLTTSIYSCKNRDNSTANQNKQSIVAQIDSVTVNNDTLQSQNNAQKMQIDQLLSEKATLDSEIALKDDLIAKLEKQVAHYKRNSRLYARKLKKLNSLIAQLKESDRARLERIGNLEKENGDLASQRDSTVRKYFELKQLASVLHASNIRMVALHLKHNGRKEKKTVRARKANILRINFDIDENRIAEDGTKDLFLVVTGPDGNQLGQSAGTFTRNDGQTINYTVLKQIALKQGEPVKDVTVDWRQNNKYKKGTYNIEIYNGGYKIGAGSVKLS